MSPPPSRELVLDMAVSLASYHDAGDITASFQPMEMDDAMEERLSRVESVDWASWIEPHNEPNSRITTSDICPAKTICFGDQNGFSHVQGLEMCPG